MLSLTEHHLARDESCLRTGYSARDETIIDDYVVERDRADIGYLKCVVDHIIDGRVAGAIRRFLNRNARRDFRCACCVITVAEEPEIVATGAGAIIIEHEGCRGSDRQNIIQQARHGCEIIPTCRRFIRTLVAKAVFKSDGGGPRPVCALDGNVRETPHTNTVHFKEDIIIVKVARTSIAVPRGQARIAFNDRTAEVS